MANRHFAKGKNSYSFSQRSGFRFPYREMIFEPGTHLWIHRSESDGMFNAVDHPQNFSPRNVGENESLEHVFSDGYKQTEGYGVEVNESTWLDVLRPKDPNVKGFDSGFDSGFGA